MAVVKLERNGFAANRLIAAMDIASFDAVHPHLKAIRFAAGQVVYEPGQRIIDAYFPLSCVISLICILSNGASAEVAIFGREGVAGIASSLMTRRAYGRYVVQIGGDAVKLKLVKYDEISKASHKLRNLMRCYFEALFGQTFQTVACNACHSVEARCCRLILSTDDRVSGDELPLTHEYLAEMLGVQRSTVSLVMKNLSAAGLISQQRGCIRVLDRARLQEASCECYQIIRSQFERLLPKTYQES